MAKSDDGHYELVLGNRQLISGFFVLIILFAIFLTLGYVLGRNSVVVSESPATASREATAVDGPRSPVRPVTSAQEKPSATAEAMVSQQAAAPSPQAATPSQPANASASQAPADSAASARAAAERVRETPPSSATAEPAPARTPVAIPETQASRAQEILNARVRLITPRKGDTFLQVAAVSRAEAELMAEQLGKRGYRAHISEVPGRDLFRVLVGPFETTPKLNETKAKLTGDGINSIVQRY